MRSELQPALSAAKEIPPAELPRLIGELEEIKATALLRLSAPAPAPVTDELLTVGQAAQRLGVSERYLYGNHKRLPFTRHMGRKVLFSSLGIDRYIASHR